MKELYNKYGHGLCSLYLIFFLIWFFTLENLENVTYNVMHCIVDDYIPFCEYFAIPYFIWFPYMFFTCAFMFFMSKRGEFYRFAFTIMSGMSLSLLICMIYPSCTHLRPDYIVDKNIFTHALIGLYAFDTSTNVFPSIHVLDSVIACVALFRTDYFKQHTFANVLNIFICVMICLSTMFTKQHSFLDVIGALILYAILFSVFYLPKYKWANNEAVVIPYKKQTNN